MRWWGWWKKTPPVTELVTPMPPVTEREVALFEQTMKILAEAGREHPQPRTFTYERRQ